MMCDPPSQYRLLQCYFYLLVMHRTVVYLYVIGHLQRLLCYHVTPYQVHLAMACHPRHLLHGAKDRHTAHPQVLMILSPEVLQQQAIE